jgi:cell division protein FtsB
MRMTHQIELLQKELEQTRAERDQLRGGTRH